MWTAFGFFFPNFPIVVYLKVVDHGIRVVQWRQSLGYDLPTEMGSNIHKAQEYYNCSQVNDHIIPLYWKPYFCRLSSQLQHPQSIYLHK